MRVLRGLLAAMVLGLAALALAPQASADMDGPCTAVIAGQDLADISSSDPSKALVVQPDEVVDYSFSASSPVVAHDALATIGPYEIALAQSSDPESEATSAVGTFDVAQVSDLAGGLYAVQAHATLADGSTCSADFLMRIDAGILDSTAGIASAAAAILAGGGVVAVSVTTATGVKSILLSLKLVP